jgi:hypothetical protein
MTKHWVSMNTEHVLGYLGLFLLILIVRLADCAYGPQQTVARQVAGFMGRRAIDAIAVVGWLVDRMPEPAPAHTHPLPASRA